MKHIALAIALAIVFPAVVFAAQTPVLDISGSSAVPSKVYAGDLITINFNLENSSAATEAKGVSVSTQLNENDFEAVKISELVGDIDPQSSKTVSFRFTAKISVLPGSYKIPVAISYKSGTDVVSYSKDVDFEISACHQLKVADVSLSNPQPHIGDNVVVYAVITNVCSSSARNVSVELRSVTNSTVAPFVVSSGTMARLGDIVPRGKAPVSFSLGVTDKVDAKTYVFSLDANCDECSRVFSNSFSFLVYGKPDLVFSNIEYSIENAIPNQKQIMQGNSFTLSVQLDNIGEEKARAVEVHADFGSGIAGTQKSFVGNIDKGDSGAAIFNLAALNDAKPGQQEGRITVVYLDELGEKQEIVENYPIYITPMPPASPVLYLVMLVLLIVALGIVYLIVRFVMRQLAIMKSQ
ncbi:MAG: hypothetical protein HY544_02810 [Candidatus Diapherotrites archaeon]|uniref:CARDB domain-containing protein n=1 Tax=Candidatus Iainarchaeum sp. TaxID=3101447 RepID=A0A8T3YL38_9ARCH|nr:hypothetical protein [Candidatus Diapherotrites archaeon]